MAEEKWEVPDADRLDGHARDVALLAKKYVREMDGSQVTVTTDDTTQQTTQRTTPRSSQVTPRPTITRTISQSAPNGAIVEKPQQHTCTTVSTSQCSACGSTQGKGTQISREVHILVLKDSSELLYTPTRPTLILTAPEAYSSSPPRSSAMSALSTTSKRRTYIELISPPNAKRRKALASLQSSGSNRRLGEFQYDSQDRTIDICAKKGIRVQVHIGSQEKERNS